MNCVHGQKRRGVPLWPVLVAMPIVFLGLVFVMRVPMAYGEEAEEKIKDTKDSITSIEKKISKVQEQRNDLAEDLGLIQRSLSSARAEIAKTESHISEAEEEIRSHENTITDLDAKITLQRGLLKGLISGMYRRQSDSLLTALIGERGLAGVLAGAERYLTIEKKVAELIGDIRTAKDEIESEKEKLVAAKTEQQRLLALKENQERVLVYEHRETAQEISEKDATIGELQEKLAGLRSNLSKLLGKSYDAKDISDAARFASKATGVRKDFLMGMLVVESDLGRYTGGCDYKQSRMSEYRLKIFKQIAESLGYNYKKLKVSCPPRGYTGTGGAMGVAQFMSDTWMGYKNAIAVATGHNPPDPWNLTDGVTAMALKLAKVNGVTEHKRSGECNAAKLYLSGTTSTKYDWYCTKVLYWADNYERLLD